MAWGDDATAQKILTSYKTWAVVGSSGQIHRPSFRVTRFLLQMGYDVVPVNPNECEEGLHGVDCYEDLGTAAQHHTIEAVDIFRRADAAGVHVDEAIEIGAKAVWMQLDVIDPAAYQRALDAGLDIVMDRCPAIDYPRLVA